MSSTQKGIFEALVILNASLEEEQTSQLVDRLRAHLEEGGAAIQNVVLWGRRRLAYPIRKKNEAYYVLYYFTMERGQSTLEPFELACRHDEEVYRFMVVKVPLKKKGHDIKPLVPEPGYLADFKCEPRSHRRYGGPHSRDRDRGDRDRDRDRGGVSAPPAPPAEVPATEAPVATPAAPAEAAAPSVETAPSPAAGTETSPPAVEATAPAPTPQVASGEKSGTAEQPAEAAASESVSTPQEAEQKPAE